MDEASFTALYESTAGPLRAYAARVTGSLAMADDVVQETFLRFLKQPPPATAPAEQRAYLFRIASNLMTDMWRRRKREIDGARLERPGTPESPSLADQLDLQRTFEQLPPRQRQLLWLACVEGHGHRDIATALGVGEGSVRVLLHRAKRALAGLIGGDPRKE